MRELAELLHSLVCPSRVAVAAVVETLCSKAVCFHILLKFSSLCLYIIA